MKKKDLVITAILVALLILAIVLTLRACAPKGNELDETEATTETVEVTEATEVVTEPTEAATEPVETAPEATQTVAASKPGNSASTNTGNATSGSGSTTVTPATTKPATVEKPNLVPAPTEPVPAVTEPAPTEHIHSWQEVYHEEVSHDVWWVVCTCGARFTTTAEWGAHVDGFSLADAMSAHSGNHSSCETVIDTPAYSTWVCACGATSDTQP